MKNILFILIAILLLGSCSSRRYSVSVASYKNDVEPALSNKCFVYGQYMNQNSPETKEYCNYIKTVLVGKNYKIVDSRAEADVIVSFNYTTSEPKIVTRTVNVPAFGVVGQSSNTTGAVTISDYSNTVKFNQNTRSKPIYGVTGVRSRQKTATVYDKYFDLDAYASPSKEGVAIWAIKSVNTGRGGYDMGMAFPYILTAVSKYIDKKSGGQKTVVVPFSSSAVKNLKSKTIKNQSK